MKTDDPIRRRRRWCPSVRRLSGVFLPLLWLAGCGDALVEEPGTVLTTDGFYRDAAQLESGTLAAYQPLIDMSLFKGWTWLALELASDQVRIDANEPNLETSAPDFLFYTAGSRGVIAAWPRLYAMIYRANLVISRAPGVQMPSRQRDSLVAEARFLRAFAYLTLTKLYGDVPLLVTEKDHEDLGVSRAPTDQVHAQVATDLSAAAAALPATRPAAQWGRATKGAALMALSDLYLWRSSFLRSGEWQKAADYSSQVMRLGEYQLNDDFIRTFLPLNKGNKEMIFVVTASGVDDRSSSSFAQLYFPRELGFNVGGGWGSGHPTDWHYDSYLPGDYRKEAGYRTQGCNIGGFCTTFEPMPWKYRPSNNGVPQERGDVDIPLYRYAETLLIYAEAQNELGSTAEAVTYLNMVRARARKGTGSENRPNPPDYTGPLDRGSVREAIFMERDWELAHEAKRWYDLVRSGPDYWLQNLRAHDPNSYAMGGLQTYKMRWPIPQSEIDANPKLTQNPGY